MSSALVECVPNFSEGRDREVIEAIARSVSGTAGVSLLGVDSGPDANRTVYTFIGDPDSVVEAAVAAARSAFDLIDMAKHKGAHPRMGALDVCPFVPVSGIDLAACARLSEGAAARIAGGLGVPVYLYEAAASRPERRSLAYLRSGGYEALSAKLARPEWLPDYGPPTFVPRWGASVVGARDFLIAYNVNLNTRDVALAREIARNVRESGRAPGRLKAVRAIAWYLEAYGCAQVSVNLLDYKITPLHVLFETVKGEAERSGLRVTGSEIVGLVPREPMLLAGRYFLEKDGKSGDASEEELIEAAVRSLGLDSGTLFSSSEKILEYAALHLDAVGLHSVYLAQKIPVSRRLKR
jgi:glutamate formiminotransferase/formiminotetrahydrofolate cyclodeaminase